MIFEMAEVVTPTRLATSAKATPCSFTNPIAMPARTTDTSLRRLADLNSLTDIPAFLIYLINHSMMLLGRQLISDLGFRFFYDPLYKFATAQYPLITQLTIH